MGGAPLERAGRADARWLLEHEGELFARYGFDASVAASGA